MNDVPRRLTERDPELWRGPVETDPRELLPEITAFTQRSHSAGLTEVVLIGSGGAALAAAAMARCGSHELTVLDTLDPGPIERIVDDTSRLRRIIVVVAGDSPVNRTLRSVLEAGFEACGVSPEAHFVALADREPSCFGALSEHALLPAALAGVDVEGLVEEAIAELDALARQEDNPGLALGAIIGGCARPGDSQRPGGRDKAVIAAYPPLAGLGPWIANLLSTIGVLPIVQDGGFPVGPGGDRFLIAIGGRPDADDATVSGPLGAQFAVWEYATAVAAYLLGVPATGPEAAAGVVRDDCGGEPSFSEGGTMQKVDVHASADALKGATDLVGVIDTLMNAIPENGYLTIMSYMDPDPGEGQATAVRRLAATLAARTGRVVTLGRGVPGRGVHLLITGNAVHKSEVHGVGLSRVAEAVGDARLLEERGRTVVRLHLNDRWAGLAQLLTAAQGGQG
jgi:glucose-6-phosphate isomerase